MATYYGGEVISSVSEGKGNYINGTTIYTVPSGKYVKMSLQLVSTGTSVSHLSDGNTFYTVTYTGANLAFDFIMGEGDTLYSNGISVLSYVARVYTKP